MAVNCSNRNETRESKYQTVFESLPDRGAFFLRLKVS